MTTRGALFLSTQVSVGLSVLKAISDSIQAISVACKGAKKGAKLVKQMTMRKVKVMPNKSTTEITSTTSTTSKTVTKTKVCARPPSRKLLLRLASRSLKATPHSICLSLVDCKVREPPSHPWPSQTVTKTKTQS